jgi:hypothetical protein
MSDLGKDIRSALLTARHVAHSAEHGLPEERAAGGGIEQVLPLIAGAAPAIGNALQSKANGFAEGGEVDKALAATAPRQQLNPQGLYSHAAAQAQALPQAKGQPQQMLASLKGVKPEEIANSGAAQKFAGQPSVTREQLASHFRQSLPQIKETRLSDDDIDEDGEGERTGGPNFEEYTIPGGENYREILLRTPPTPPNYEKLGPLRAAQTRADVELRNWHRNHPNEWASDSPERDRLNAAVRQANEAYNAEHAAPKANDFYHRPHWGEIPNVLAHLRLSDRAAPAGKSPEPEQKILDETFPNSPERRARLEAHDRDKKGEKILHMEELQSDWGQQGRQKGFREDKPYFRYRNSASRNTSPDFETQEALEKHAKAYPESLRAHFRLEHGVTPGDPNQPPKGPYVGTTNGWTDLGLKRALREAALGKYDRLAWTPGQEQADRYGLAKHLSALAYDPESKELSYQRHGGSAWDEHPESVAPEALSDLIGKEAAEKLLATERHPLSGNHILEGQDLRTGAHKMKKYYDEMVPGRLKEILKKLGHETKFEPLTIKHPKDDAGRTEHTLHSLHIPPDLREKILKGMPAYASGGAVAQNTEQPATIPARQNPNFQKWFAGSKVVNGQGQPDTLYHGTAGDFDTFKQKRNDVGMHFGTIGQANDRLSYQRDRGVKTEAGMNLMPVHLAIRNPLRMQDLGNWDGNGLAWALAKEFPEQAKWIALNVRTPKQARDFLQSKGHDGIVYKNTGEVGGSEPYREEIKAATQELHKHFPKNKNSFDHTDQMHPAYQAWASAHDKYREHRENNAEDSYIAFHPTQVKSAIGNSGNFDPKDPSVVRAMGGAVAKKSPAQPAEDPVRKALNLTTPAGG